MEYFTTKSYLVSLKEKLVLPIAFKSAIEAIDYSKEHNLRQRGYNVVMKGSDVRRLLGSGRISEPREVDTSGENGRGEPRKETYTPSELADIAKIFYETTGRKTATVYTPTGPLYGRWENLIQSERDQSIKGLQARIEREGLLGYLERKRPAMGDELTNSIIAQLRAKGYLSSPGPSSVPMTSLFPLGMTVMTAGVAARIAEDPAFGAYVGECLKRHANGDWGDLCEEDKKENEYSLDKYLRLFSAYDKYPMPKIYIITEADRSVTTTLFPEEY